MNKQEMMKARYAKLAIARKWDATTTVDGHKWSMLNDHKQRTIVRRGATQDAPATYIFSGYVDSHVVAKAITLKDGQEITANVQVYKWRRSTLVDVAYMGLISVRALNSKGEPTFPSAVYTFTYSTAFQADLLYATYSPLVEDTKVAHMDRNGTSVMFMLDAHTTKNGVVNKNFIQKYEKAVRLLQKIQTDYLRHTSNKIS